MSHADVEQAVQRVVTLRRIADAVLDPVERRRLERVTRELRREIGVGVPKRPAARLLGVSVQALEPWIERGLLPAVRKPGSTRELVDAETLIAVAEEVTRRREAGESRGVVAASLRELEGAGRLPRKLRPKPIRTRAPPRVSRDYSARPATRCRRAESDGRRSRGSRGRSAEEAELVPLQPPGPRTQARFFDLLRILSEHRVEFVVIGGLAVALHGYVRATKDIDIVPEQSRENLTRLWNALVEIDATPTELEEFRTAEMPVAFSLEALIEGGGIGRSTHGSAVST